MKSLYPDGGYKVLAEHAAGSRHKPTGMLDCGKRCPVYAYRSHSRLLYREYGYVAVGEDSYVVLLKNALVPRAAIAAACVAVIAGAVIFAFAMARPQEAASLPEEPVAAAGKQLELEEGAVDWEGEKPQDTGGSGAVRGIAIPGFKSITVEANKKDVKVNFQNPEGNPCYFEISLLLADGTELYKSKMIEPGKGLYEITLNQPLKAGEYDAVVKYDTFSLEGLAPMNGAEVQIKLIAQ
ncbi:MAG: hypothetical protein GXW96_07795, partial [Christensenellaceae bacterium]|nr:hypothetical protein [Christensenellaceae bacterium]